MEKEETPDYEYMLKVSNCYKQLLSIKAVSEHFHITRVKTRKILVTTGDIDTPFSRKAIALKEESMELKDIADIMHCSAATVCTYLPYENVLYKSEHKSKNAERISQYRKRNAYAEKHMIRTGKKTNDIMKKKKDCKRVTRLHLELAGDEDISDVLHQYGDVQYGNTISRDVLVPSDMQLWALNYTIQRCFGWQNSHLHRFNLSDDRLKQITEDNAESYFSLCGYVFRDPFMDEEDQFWADDYTQGSPKAWFRKKYTGPYVSDCIGEEYDIVRENMESYKAHYDDIYTVEWYKDSIIGCYKAGTGTSDDRFCVENRKLKDLPVLALKWVMDDFAGDLLERLTIDQVLTYGVIDLKQSSDELNSDVYGITDTLYYFYDFGDGWKVKVTRISDFNDLLENNRITMEEGNGAIAQVKHSYRPVMIARDGVDVVDDLGGYSMIPCFLRAIHNDDSEDNQMYDNAEDTIAWAKNQGWSYRNIALKNRL